MFDAIVETIEANRTVRYRLTRDHVSLSFAQVVHLWHSDEEFRTYTTQLLSDAPFAAYRWETPMLTSANSHQPFQFVLLNCPSFVNRQTDHSTFADYFTDDNADEGVVSITNLSGDARLIIPSPRTDDSAYGHLAAFIRSAPKAQRDAFWRIVGQAVKSNLGASPIWLSTAGGGVAWLHVRIDSHPKYYGHVAFKTA